MPDTQTFAIPPGSDWTPLPGGRQARHDGDQPVQVTMRYGMPYWHTGVYDATGLYGVTVEMVQPVIERTLIDLSDGSATTTIDREG